ncbi:MAG: protoporphyrinogen oxidase [Candidatus Melainabacteria bacterium]|nr:protoporphyrinogen oxidase [Candidatus Melainabacteria bacterium]
MKDVIIIGAGIAGLSAAFELHKNNTDFQILETSNRVGGVIESLKIDDFLIETGPHTFSSVSLETLELIKDLGIEDSLIEANPLSNKRYIYLNNKLIALPSGPVEFFKSEVLSKEGKKTLFEELFIKKEDKEESVEDFISRRFGREVLKNLIQPFLNSVYAGDVKKLSANAVFPKLKSLENSYNSVILGSILSGRFRNSFKKLTLYSFLNGMETLSKELYERLKNKITLNAKNIEITRAKDFFIVTFIVNNKPINYTANSILLAIPAYKIPDFAYLVPNDYMADFFHIEYLPLATVNQTIEKSKVEICQGASLDGFGFLCAKEPHRKLLGTIWSSSIFPNRALADKILLTSYIGGAYHRKITDQTEDEIKNLVTKELCETLNISDHALLETIHIKVHSHAIPQYNMGHLEKVKRIEELMDKNYGLFFTGNYLHGISINDTIKTSKAVAQKINSFLNTVVKKQETLLVK